MYWNKPLVKESVKILHRRDRWWLFPCTFILGVCVISLFTDNYWIWLLFGLLTFPLAVIMAVTDAMIDRRKKLIKDTVQDYVATRK